MDENSINTESGTAMDVDGTDYGENESPSGENSRGTGESEPAMRSGNPARLIVPILLLALAGVGVWYFLLRDKGGPENVIKVSGRIATDDASVATKASGRVKEVLVREGDKVEEGDAIAVLDDEQLSAREEQAQTAVDQAEIRVRRAQQQIGVYEAQLSQSEIGVEQASVDADGRVRQAEGLVSQAQSQLSQSEAQLAKARVDLKQAEYDEQRLTRLFRTGDISERQARQAQTNAEGMAKVVEAQRKQVDNAKAALVSAKGNLNVAKASKSNPRLRGAQSLAIKRQIEQAYSDIDAANKEAQRARAQLVEAQANQKDLTIKAPFSGVVTTRSVEPGEVISTGTTIITLMDPDTIYLRAFVPEGQIGKVVLGQEARVFLDSNPKEAILATVSRIDPEAAFTPENTYFQDERVKQVVGVKLLIKKPNGGAKPGMPADGEIVIKN
ncbi:MAG: HlyD family efflux transporter periplasmic adaptor subunit [Pyrinomonadaceae bacterium]